MPEEKLKIPPRAADRPPMHSNAFDVASREQYPA